MIRSQHVLWLLLISLAASAAGKRPPLPQVLRGEARTQYEAARTDFKASRFRQALSGFLQAYVLSQDPRLLWNQAACLRKLERNAEALGVVDRYLSDGDLTPEEQDEARRAQVALRALVGVVHLELTPEDAVVSIDGAPVERARGVDLYLEPGRHAAYFSREGFQEELSQVAIQPGDRVVWTIVLRALPAVVEPATRPEVLVQPTPAPPPPVRRAPWVVAGAGVAAWVVGGIFLATSAADYERLVKQCGTSCAPAQWGGARTREQVGVALLIAGSTALVGGLAWWWLGGSTSAKLSVSPTDVHLEVRF